MRRVLVAGAGGFLAAPLLRRLAGRATVVRLNRSPRPGALAFDLSDPAQARAAVAAARPDQVYLLAGTTKPASWDELWRAHVAATVNLLDALSGAGRPARVVVAGSSAAYGAAGGARRPAEDAPLEPVSAYGASKLAQELAALSFSRGPVEVVVARIFNVLGPGVPENLAPGAFARQLAAAAGRESSEILVGDLSPRRDYLDVRDAAAALETLMRRGKTGEAYNVGSGRATSMRALFEGLARAAGARARPRFDPERARGAQIRELAADARKLRALGWAPRVPLARSLADTVAWWKGR